DARILQAVADENRQQHQCQEQVVVHRDRVDVESEQLVAPPEVQPENGHRINLPDAFRPVGDVDRVIQVVHENADNFPETQGDDGQVIPAQLEYGHTEDDPC